MSPCFVTNRSHDRATGLACYCSSPDFTMCITQSLSYLPKIPAGKGELSGPRPLPVGLKTNTNHGDSISTDWHPLLTKNPTWATKSYSLVCHRPAPSAVHWSQSTECKRGIVGREYMYLGRNSKTLDIAVDAPRPYRLQPRDRQLIGSRLQA